MERTQPIPVFVALGRRKARCQFIGCKFNGFHQPESADGNRYVWTRGAAEIDCFFPQATRVQYVWIELAYTAPAGSRLTVQVDNRTMVENDRVHGGNSITIHWPESRVIQHLKLSLFAETFVPKSTMAGSEDDRELGVAVRAVVFAKRWGRYRSGIDIAKPLYRRMSSWVSSWLPRRAA
jgi:hypothetical protein